MSRMPLLSAFWRSFHLRANGQLFLLPHLMSNGMLLLQKLIKKLILAGTNHWETHFRTPYGGPQKKAVSFPEGTAIPEAVHGLQGYARKDASRGLSGP